MKLADWQRDFRDWLVHGSSDAATRLDPHNGVGLAVYQNNYRVQLTHVLEASYPLLLLWLGDELFREAAITHVNRRPPRSWTLDSYGNDFEDTLRELLPDNPDVHELAWIEWVLSESFVASDAPTITQDALADVDWDNARLSLSPSLRERIATTNAQAIWLALYDGSQPPEAEMLTEPAGLIVWRQGFQCRVKPVDAIEHAALLSLHENDRFDALCDLLVDRLGEDAGIARAGELLAAWIGAGVVTGIHA